MIKLDANENPYRPPEELCRRLGEFSRRLDYNRYPDKTYIDLRKALADYCGWPADLIMAGNGSDELILLLLLAYGGPNSRMITVQPTFTMYAHYARATGTPAVEKTYRLEESAGELQYPRQEIMAEAEKDQPGIIFLCSPNNPTGELRARSWLEKLLDRTELPVVVDEAYYEFSGETFIDLLEKYENLIILRTLSKAFGLAGLRVGYLLSSSAVYRKLEVLRSPYNISRYSAGAAGILLEAREFYQKSWKKIRSGREFLYQGIKSMNNLNVFPSRGNYLLFQTEVMSPAKVYQKLLERGIKIRYWNDLALFGQALRVSAGRREENELFLSELTEVLKEA